MRRDELMDGYIWLYEQAYGTSLLLDRMERNWQRRPRTTSSLPEKAFIAARLGREVLRAMPSYAGSTKTRLACCSTATCTAMPGICCSCWMAMTSRASCGAIARQTTATTT